MTQVHVFFEDAETGERWDFEDGSFYPSEEAARHELAAAGFEETDRVQVHFVPRFGPHPDDLRALRAHQRFVDAVVARAADWTPEQRMQLFRREDEEYGEEERS